jgi:hypothetical protein
MVDAIILSKDRPAQLHLLLQSIEQNFISSGTITVLYKASASDFQIGYDILMDESERFDIGIVFLQETNFSDNIFHILRNTYRHMCFFTDDDIVYQKIVLPDEELDILFDEYQCACLSLRLGHNTTIQYNYTGERSLTPAMTTEACDKYTVWNHNSIPHGNFGYPMSVDGHIFRLDMFTQMLHRITFENPNSMEGRLHTHKKAAPPNMACLRHSAVVNTPLNRVQEICKNRAGEQFGMTAEDLNTQFLEGKRIDFEAIDFSNIVGCHQELELCMK